jgi:hypothetical protein
MRYADARLAPQAEIETRLKAAVGAPIWDPRQIESLKEEALERFKRPRWAPYWNFIVFFSIIPLGCLNLAIMAFAPAEAAVNWILGRKVEKTYPRQLAASLLRSWKEMFNLALVVGPVWSTSCVEADGTYRHEGVKRTPPAFAVACMNRIRQVFPKAHFKVEYLSFDPILICEIHEGLESDQYEVLVWDTIDGKDVIVPPPAR